MHNLIKSRLDQNKLIVEIYTKRPVYRFTECSNASKIANISQEFFAECYFEFPLDCDVYFGIDTLEKNSFELPDNVTFEKCLDLSDSKVTRIGTNTTVKQDLILINSEINQLPCDLKVLGNIYGGVHHAWMIGDLDDFRGEFFTMEGGYYISAHHYNLDPLYWVSKLRY
jgi:hypothetical protein